MSNLKCDIFIEKSEFNFLKISITNLSNNDSILENEINSYLDLFNILLNECFNKTKYFQDTQYQELVNNIKLEYDNKLNKVQQELILKDNELHLVNNSFNSLFENIKSNIESNLHKQFKNNEQRLIDEIDYYKIKLDALNVERDNIINSKVNDVIREYEFKLECINNKYNQLNANLNTNILLKSEAIKNEYDIIINNLNNDIKNLQSDLSRANNNSNTFNSISQQIFNIDHKFSNNLNQITQFFYNADSSKSGELGENFIYDYLSDFLQLNDGSITKVNGKSNAGDIYLKYDKLKCCIESKNHSASIRQENIKRFIDVDIKNPEYNSGIFVSFKTDFVNSSNIKHFHLQIIDNKPIIFISNLVKHPDHIILAIKVLNFILHHSDAIQSDDYISLLHNHLTILNELLSTNNNIIKQLNASNISINKSIKLFESTLNIKSNHSKYKCSSCDFNSNNKAEFNKHLKKCKLE